jgi:hypothetical protein
MMPGQHVYLKHTKKQMQYVSPALVDGYSILVDLAGNYASYPDHGFETYASREDVAWGVVEQYEWYLAENNWQVSGLKRENCSFLHALIVDALEGEANRRV